jgi:hypothetical protein
MQSMIRCELGRRLKMGKTKKKVSSVAFTTIDKEPPNTQLNYKMNSRGIANAM